jgi:glycerol-3-phosphate acyltransferase PlsY
MMLSMFAILSGYLLGSVPFAYLLARRLAGIDLRLAGSRNIGAANAWRTTRPAVAGAVLALDVAKGAAAVWLAGLAGGDLGARATAGVAAVVGHVYPFWLRFRGGKGVAVACGVFAVLTPAAAAMAAAVFAATVLLTRYVSLGSIAATIALPPLAYGAGAPATVVVAAIGVGALIVFRHRANVERLRAGTERRFGERV